MEKKEVRVKIYAMENDDYNELYKVIGEKHYFARHTYYGGEWYFVCDPLGYCELDHPVPENYTFVVCGEGGKELFRSTNADETRIFPSFRQKCKLMAKGYREENSDIVIREKGHREWLLNYLTGEVLEKLKGEFCIEENFVWCWNDVIETVPVKEFEWLDMKCGILQRKVKSRYSKAEWFEYVAGTLDEQYIALYIGCRWEEDDDGRD